MADDIANILLRLGADTSEGDDKLEAFRKSLVEFGHIEETAEAKVEIKGEASLTKAIKALEEFGRIRVSATGDVKINESSLDLALRKVQELGEKRVEIPVGFNEGFLQKALDDVRALGAARPQVPVGFTGNVEKDARDPGIQRQITEFTRLAGGIGKTEEKSRGFVRGLVTGIGGIRSETGLLGKGLDAVGFAMSDIVTKFGPQATKVVLGIAKGLDAIGGQSGVIGGPTSALSHVFTSLATEGPKGIIQIISLAAVAAAAINALIATVVALGASLILAAAGVAALATAFVVALGPAVLVAIGVFKQLATIIEAVSTGRAQSAKQVDALKAATLQQQAAQNQLTKATTGGNKAAVDAIQQQKDAVLSLANAYLGLESAKLGITDAALALERANLDLKQFKANLPGGLTVGDLIKKATDISVTGGGRQTAQPGGGAGASKAAELQFDQLQQAKAHALLGVQLATQHVAEATNTYAKAQLAVTGGIGGTTRATQAATAAAARLEAANIAVQRAQLAVDKAKGTDQVNTLSKAGQALIPIFTKLADTVKAAFGPAIDVVLTSIGKVAKDLSPLVKSLTGPFTQLGAVMGGALKQIAAALSTPAMVTVFKEFIADSGKLISIITPGFIAFLTVLFQIAKDAMPALLIVFKAIGGVLSDVAKHPDKIAAGVRLAIDAFFAWGKLIAAVGLALIRLIALAGPLGTQLVNEVVKLVLHFAKFLNTKQGRDQVIAWIKEGISSFKQVITIVVGLVKAISPLITTLIHVGDTILKLGPLFKILGPIVNFILAQMLAPVNLFLDALTFVGTHVNGLVPIFQRFGGIAKIALEAVLSPARAFKDIIDFLVKNVPKIKLPKLGGVGSSILKHLIPGLGLLTAAEGGIATHATPGVFGESGPEALIPLTDRVFGALSAALAPRIGQQLKLVGAQGAGKTVHQTNHIAVNAPAGRSPDTNHFVAEIENRLDALGAVA